MSGLLLLLLQLMLQPCAAGSTAMPLANASSWPNVWGGLSARPKGDSGNLFAFSGLDGTTVESSLAFVAIFDPSPYSLIFGTASKRTLRLHCPQSENGTVLVSTGDTFIVECPMWGAQTIQMAWAEHDLLVGETPADGPSLDGATRWSGSRSQANCSVSADAHESLALCVEGSNDSTRWALAISVGGGSADQAAAVHHALGWLEQSTRTVDTVISQRLKMYADGGLLSNLPAKYRRLAGKAVSVMRVNALSPEGKIKQYWSTPDRSPHQWMWLWDSCYHAMAMNLLTVPAAPAITGVDSSRKTVTETNVPGDRVAWDYIKSVLLGADSTGAISIERTPNSVGTEVLQTQPPLLAWATAENYQACNARAGGAECMERLAFAFPRLEAYIRWDMTHRRDRTNRTQLYFWTKGTESGMDNSQRWDFAPGRGEKASKTFPSLLVVDLSVFVAREAALLSKFATTLNNSVAHSRWAAVSTSITKDVHELLWDNDNGLYMDLFSGPTPKPGFSSIKAVTGLMPLWLPNLPKERLSKLLVALNDETRGFNASAPLATVALDTDGFSTDMWRGPMWLNTNWHIALALLEQGEEATAIKLLRRTVDVVLADYQRYGVIFEFYDAKNNHDPRTLMRKGSPKGGVRDYHWSAAITLLMLDKLHNLNAL